eukprot:TRINITY_DN55717_c0_g1_i1.p1 TRINITY_DN55717_c0_g1~~TRINITY_DN55717_c0_g1_i1.p1  ORF type:complete len:1039 (+),score=185.50 TRINITY_DN55717_c0_g1_i1:27-3119(+)
MTAGARFASPSSLRAAPQEPDPQSPPSRKWSCSPPPEGSMLDRFERCRVLGRGSFGVAILVREHDHLGGSPLRVIKEVDLSSMAQASRAEAEMEAKVLGALSHPNVIALHESFVECGRLHIVMEFAAGGDLGAIIRGKASRGEHFDQQETLRVLAQCCSALEHVHRMKILHRDLKAQNIFLTEDGVAKLGDFGIAKVLTHTAAMAKTSIGTPSYLSPEACDNVPYGSKADIWSMGVVFHEMLAMELPFKANSIASLVVKIVSRDPGPLPEGLYEDKVLSVAGWLLTKEPESRPSASEILATEVVRGHVGLPIEPRRKSRSENVSGLDEADASGPNAAALGVSCLGPGPAMRSSQRCFGVLAAVLGRRNSLGAGGSPQVTPTSRGSGASPCARVLAAALATAVISPVAAASVAAPALQETLPGLAATLRGPRAPSLVSTAMSESSVALSSRSRSPSASPTAQSAPTVPPRRPGRPSPPMRPADATLAAATSARRWAAPLTESDDAPRSPPRRSPPPQSPVNPGDEFDVLLAALKAEEEAAKAASPRTPPPRPLLPTRPPPPGVSPPVPAIGSPWRKQAASPPGHKEGVMPHRRRKNAASSPRRKAVSPGRQQVTTGQSVVAAGKRPPLAVAPRRIPAVLLGRTTCDVTPRDCGEKQRSRSVERSFAAAAGQLEEADASPGDLEEARHDDCNGRGRARRQGVFMAWAQPQRSSVNAGAVGIAGSGLAVGGSSCSSSRSSSGQPASGRRAPSASAANTAATTPSFAAAAAKRPRDLSEQRAARRGFASPGSANATSAVQGVEVPPVQPRRGRQTGSMPCVSSSPLLSNAGEPSMPSQQHRPPRGGGHGRDRSPIPVNPSSAAVVSDSIARRCHLRGHSVGSIGCGMAPPPAAVDSAAPPPVQVVPPRRSGAGSPQVAPVEAPRRQPGRCHSISSRASTPSSVPALAAEAPPRGLFRLRNGGLSPPPADALLHPGRKGFGNVGSSGSGCSGSSGMSVNESKFPLRSPSARLGFAGKVLARVTPGGRQCRLATVE